MTENQNNPDALETEEGQVQEIPKLAYSEVKAGLVDELTGFHKLVYRLFTFLFLGIIKKVYEAKKEEVAQKNAHRNWAGSDDSSIKEEDIKLLKEVCKNLRKEIKKKEDDLANSSENSPPQSVIDDLKIYLNNRESELTDKKERFAERVSQLDNAKKEAAYQEARRQFFGKIIITEIWTVTLLCLLVTPMAIAGIIEIIPGSQNLPVVSSGIINFFVIFLVLTTSFFVSRYREVPHNKVWAMEAFGRYVATWQPGPHFVGPFMERREEVYLGDFMDEVNGQEGSSNKIDFLDSSAGIKATYYWRVFSPYNAVYANEDVVSAVREKMEAGLRAYYGQRTIDIAIESQASVDLREIITQDATEAKVFKNWGVEITSLAVTDFFLPEEVDNARRTKLEAEKQREVALVELETAKVKRDTAEINGAAEGQKIRAMAEALKITPVEAMNLDLNWRKYTAMGASEMLFMSEGSGGGNSAVEQGAQAGAAAGAAARSAGKPRTEERPDEDQTS